MSYIPDDIIVYIYVDYITYLAHLGSATRMNQQSRKENQRLRWPRGREA